MLDLDAQIREFIDSGADPVTAEEITSRSPGWRETAPAPRRGPTFRRRRLVTLGVVGLAAAVLAVALTVASPHGVPTGPGPASAAAVLDTAAKAAAAQHPLVPRAGQYLYVQTIESQLNGSTFPPGQRLSWFFAEEAHQTWSSPAGAGGNIWSVVGQPQFVTGADRTTWEAAGSPPIKSGWGGGGNVTFYNVADLPTNPGKIKPYFASQSGLVVDQPSGRDTAWELETAADFLQAGASSRQRAALLTFLARLPGVHHSGSATSVGTEKRGELLTLPSDRTGMSIGLVLNTRTSELIELREIATKPVSRIGAGAASGVGAEEMPHFAPGQVESYVDFEYAAIADSATAPPTGAPPLPAAWPYGDAREPRQGSLYP